MKQPKKLTRRQKDIVCTHHLNPKNWMVVSETSEILTVRNKLTYRIRKLKIDH